MRFRFVDNGENGPPGSLQVNVSDAFSAAPLDNANVSVYNPQSQNLLASFTTDSSGQTPAFELPAPPLEFSFAYSNNKPYSVYDVTVERSGFEPQSIKGVQILPTTRSVQDARLAGVAGQRPEIIVIDPNTLWGIFPPKIPEDQVKPLPPGRGLVVLPDPVIPEFVIVHQGVPSDASAENVWVPFKDYIKNVACCEIYSTWPYETLKANVLSIISFALNRIYTEWYLGRGYDFTITNSTAYDQAFSYGRNIFTEISLVVDEFFTTFVTKPGIRQPLLTSFCDGQRTRCPNGLEQWGSKDLGEAGYDALSIIRYYYGDDAFLLQATQVEGVPRSYPGSPLVPGDTGENVRVIQRQLNAISDKFPAIPKVRVDGIYGEQLETAVRQFQTIFSLPATGIVDFATWYRISHIYVAVTRIAETV